MIYREFGATGLRVSAIGLGTWPLGGPNQVGPFPMGWPPISDRQVESIVGAALDAGINLIDTSDFYGRGRCEELLGRFVPASRTDVVVATKVGLIPELTTSQPPDLVRRYTPAHIERSVEGSLRRLKRDCIDIYQLHGPDPAAMRSDETWSALDRLKTTGKIRFVGVSMDSDHLNPEMMRLLYSQPLIDSIQVKYNLAQTKVGGILREAEPASCGFIARVPFEHGLLLGKYQRLEDFAEDDHRRRRISVSLAERVQAFRRGLLGALPHRSSSPTEVPLLWLLGEGIITVVLCGATTPEQIKENADLVDLPPLSSEEWAAAEAVAQQAFG